MVKIPEIRSVGKTSLGLYHSTKEGLPIRSRRTLQNQNHRYICSKPEKSGQSQGGNFWQMVFSRMGQSMLNTGVRRNAGKNLADFDGERASKILFESEGVSGYSPQSFRSWKETAEEVLELALKKQAQD